VEIEIPLETLFAADYGTASEEKLSHFKIPQTQTACREEAFLYPRYISTTGSSTRVA